MEKALLVISYGTSGKEAAEASLGKIEEELQEAFPQRRFYRAWSSDFLRRKVREKDNTRIDSPKEALKRIREDGVRDLLIQPMHILDGMDFRAVRQTVSEFLSADPSGFDRVRIGASLLFARQDAVKLARILMEEYTPYGEGKMTVFVGHGSRETGFDPYPVMQEIFREEGNGYYSVGTLEGEPGTSAAVSEAKKRQVKEVMLVPLFVSAGGHVLKDLAGDGGVWRSELQREGIGSVCIQKGLGEYPRIRELYVSKAKEADRDYPFFPMFFDLSEKRIVVVGGGRIASRRALTLLDFTGGLTIIAPEVTEELLEEEQTGRIRICRKSYEPEDIRGAWLVLAATDDCEVNARIRRDCNREGILVNVANDRTQSDFYFPGIALSDGLAAGISAGGKDHKRVKQVTKELREFLKCRGNI